MDARVGIGITDERQQLVTSPEPPLPEHLISPQAAPIRRLPIGAEPQLGGGVHLRVWAPRCREVVVEIEGLEPAATATRDRRLLLTVERAGASRHALSLPPRSG